MNRSKTKFQTELQTPIESPNHASTSPVSNYSLHNSLQTYPYVFQL